MYELSMDQVLCVSGGSEASAAAGAAAGESAGRAAMQTVKAVGAVASTIVAVAGLVALFS